MAKNTPSRSNRRPRVKQAPAAPGSYLSLVFGRLEPPKQPHEAVDGYRTIADARADLRGIAERIVTTLVRTRGQGDQAWWAMLLVLVDELAEADPRVLVRMQQEAMAAGNSAQKQRDLVTRVMLVKELETAPATEETAGTVVSLASGLSEFRARRLSRTEHVQAVASALERAERRKGASTDRAETLFRAAMRALGLPTKKADRMLEFKSKRDKRAAAKSRQT